MISWILVEDEPDLYDSLSEMYELLGARALAFTSGEEALDWIDAVARGEVRTELPKLALVDIRLPGSVDGIQVTAALRQTAAIRTMPVILMTAYHLSLQDEKDVLQRSGANRLLYKPLPKLEELRQIFTQLIEEAS